MRFDPGFDSAHLIIVFFNVADHGYNQAQGRDFQRRVLERARATPGVAAATLSNDWPFHVSLSRTMSIEGRDSASRSERIRLAGLPAGAWAFPCCAAAISRAVPQTGPRVVIVNQDAADSLLAGEDPVGKRVQFFGENTDAEVIGVAGTGITRPSARSPAPCTFHGGLFSGRRAIDSDRRRAGCGAGRRCAARCSPSTGTCCCKPKP